MALRLRKGQAKARGETRRPRDPRIARGAPSPFYTLGPCNPSPGLPLHPQEFLQTSLRKRIPWLPMIPVIRLEVYCIKDSNERPRKIAFTKAFLELS